jgi:hypothetical protein
VIAGRGAVTAIVARGRATARRRAATSTTTVKAGGALSGPVTDTVAGEAHGTSGALHGDVAELTTTEALTLVSTTHGGTTVIIAAAEVAAIIVTAGVAITAILTAAALASHWGTVTVEAAVVVAVVVVVAVLTGRALAAGLANLDGKCGTVELLSVELKGILEVSLVAETNEGKLEGLTAAESEVHNLTTAGKVLPNLLVSRLIGDVLDVNLVDVVVLLTLQCRRRLS